MKFQIDDKKIVIEISHTEHRFIEFCRQQKYVEGKLIVMGGEPVKLLEPIKSIRFDIANPVDKSD